MYTRNLLNFITMIRLHILNEFDKAVSTMLTDVEQLPIIFEEWEKRGQLVRASRGVEFVLSMRRATLDLAVQLQQEIDNKESEILKHEIGKTWLKSAKIARKYAFLLIYTSYLFFLLLYIPIMSFVEVDYTNKLTCIYYQLVIHVHRNSFI